jgi:hypothetical protein
MLELLKAFFSLLLIIRHQGAEPALEVQYWSLFGDEMIDMVPKIGNQMKI